MAVLQQLDRDIIRTADERHMAVTRRPVDSDPCVHQALAGFVDILDTVGEMPEIAAFIIAAFIPIVCEFDLRVLVAGGGKKDQREAPRFAIETA